MIPMTLAQIAEVVGGKAHGDPETLVRAQAVVDSRLAETGSLFVAMAGESTDGHDHVDDALRAGASASLVQRIVTGPCVVVDDSMAAIAELARWTLAELRSRTDIQVVALTGSQGKTSVKDLLAHILETQGPTISSEGSFNNELGVPLTVLRADLSTRWLVVEMGARGPGHISYLCSIAPPDVAAVLNVGSAHLGEFGSVEIIAQAKGEIIDALGTAGTAILNASDPRVAAMAERVVGPVVTFGEGADVSLSGPVTLNNEGHAQVHLNFQGHEWSVTIPQIGFHHGINAAAAFAMASACQVSPEDIISALSTATARSAMRMEAVRTPAGVLILNDAYNANPESMTSGLEALVEVAQDRSIAVLGAMLELGAESHSQHRRIGEFAATLEVDCVVVVGENARQIATGAGSRAVFCETVHVAISTLLASLRPTDTVLVKASRSVKLEDVVTALMAP